MKMAWKNVAIPQIFTSYGMTELFYLYISLAELAASSNLYIVVSLVTQFETSIVFSGQFVVLMMRIA